MAITQLPESQVWVPQLLKHRNGHQGHRQNAEDDEWTHDVDDESCAVRKGDAGHRPKTCSKIGRASRVKQVQHVLGPHDREDGQAAQHLAEVDEDFDGQAHVVLWMLSIAVKEKQKANQSNEQRAHQRNLAG